MNSYKNINKYNLLTKRDLVNKLVYKSITEMPLLKNVFLNAGSKGEGIKTLASSALLVELMTGRSMNLNKCNRPNLHLKIKKGHPAGVVLKFKKRNANTFVANLLLKTVPGLKNFDLSLANKTPDNSISFTFKKSHIKTFSEVKQAPHLFKDVGPLDVSVTIKNGTTKLESLMIIAPRLSN